MKPSGESHSHTQNPYASYAKLAAIISVNAVVMFFLTYVTIDTLDHFHFNVNRIYMALLMVAPMVVLMLFAMRSMFQAKTLNLVLYAGFALLFVVIFGFVRTQTGVGDEQFLRAMIPHHSGAILMCQESNITDREILDLCVQIVEAQKEEIAEMERILARH